MYLALSHHTLQQLQANGTNYNYTQHTVDIKICMTKKPGSDINEDYNTRELSSSHHILHLIPVPRLWLDFFVSAKICNTAHLAIKNSSRVSFMIYHFFTFHLDQYWIYCYFQVKHISVSWCLTITTSYRSISSIPITKGNTSFKLRQSSASRYL